MTTEAIRCSRCRRPIAFANWEEGWPVYGHLDLGYAGQAFATLTCADNVALDEDFAVHAEGHPALIRNEAQHITFQWGNGGDYDSPGFRLCSDCQETLLNLIGWFFGFPHRVGAKRREAGTAQHYEGFPLLRRIAAQLLYDAQPESQQAAVELAGLTRAQAKERDDEHTARRTQLYERGQLIADLTAQVAEHRERANRYWRALQELTTAPEPEGEHRE